MANLIDGKLLSQKIKDEVKKSVSEFKNTFNRDISLAVILVGENPASAVYVKNKLKATEYVGIKSLSYHMPEDSSFEDVSSVVKTLANDDNVDGILVQLPLPKHIDEEKILSLIPVEKDVDGFTSMNAGNLLLGKDCLYPCTPHGIIQMINSIGFDLTGKKAVVLGRSNIVGKPIALMLLEKNATVTICHSKTTNLKDICKEADVIVAAIGRPKFVTKDMVKEGAVVIDVGINRMENGLCGDVDFENVKDIASYITPVPGGVGPMTIAMLMSNAYTCATRRENNNA